MERTILEQLATVITLIGFFAGVGLALIGAASTKLGFGHPKMILVGLIVGAVSLFFLCTPTV